MKRFVALCAVFALFAANALADIRLPDTPKPKASKTIDTRLTIRLDRNANEAKLIIPKNQVKQLRAQLDEIDGGGGGGDTTAETPAPNFTRVQTVASGLLLSLALVFGGVWAARARKVSSKTGKVLSIVAGLFFSGAVAMIAFGNVAPPPIETRSITGKIFSPPVVRYKYVSGDIKLEVSSDASGIELVVPDATDKNKPGEELREKVKE